MKGVEIALSCFACLGTLCVFLGTVALLSRCIETEGYIEDVFENCKGLVMYKDYTNIIKYSLLNIPCKNNGLKVVPITYSLWNTDSVSIGNAFISYNNAIYLYKTGIITLLLSLPGIVALRWKQDSDLINLFRN